MQHHSDSDSLGWGVQSQEPRPCSNGTAQAHLTPLTIPTSPATPHVPPSCPPQAIQLSAEVRRLHQQALKNGQPGMDPSVLLAAPQARPRTLSPTSLSGSASPQSLDPEDDGEGEDGTLELGSGQGQFQRSNEFKTDIEAYGDTGEQLMFALQEVRNLREENQRLCNEHQITKAGPPPPVPPPLTGWVAETRAGG